MMTSARNAVVAASPVINAAIPNELITQSLTLDVARALAIQLKTQPLTKLEVLEDKVGNN